MIGRRTIVGLGASLVPSRTSCVVACLALCAGIGMHVAASIGQTFDVPGAIKLGQIAHTFEALPLWVLMGGALTQFAKRIEQAWDNFRAWRTKGDV